MTREELLAELLVERFGEPTREHRRPPQPEAEDAAAIRWLDLHDATRRRAKPRKRG